MYLESDEVFFGFILLSLRNVIFILILVVLSNNTNIPPAKDLVNLKLNL